LLFPNVWIKLELFLIPSQHLSFFYQSIFCVENLKVSFVQSVWSFGWENIDYFRFGLRSAVATAAVAITIPIVIAAIIKSQRGKASVFVSGCKVSFGMLGSGEVAGIVADGEGVSGVVAEGIIGIVADAFFGSCVSGGSTPIQGPGGLLPNQMVALRAAETKPALSLTWT
jgi:hypothetical protein